MKGGGAYDRSVRVFSSIYAFLGAVILVLTLARGGGPTSVGFLLGLAFVALGVGRYLVQRKMTDHEDDPK